MNKLFENILDRLEDTKDIEHDDSVAEVVSTRIWNKAIHRAKQIVKEVAEEYNGGWIPCSERLPEIGQEVIVSTKNGSVYSNIYYDYIDNNAKEPCFHRWDDEMWNCFMLDVIAWQPLPKPFKERD